MPSRSVRRRQNKHLQRLHDLPTAERDARAAQRLLEWRREAYRRARSLSEPEVWALAHDPRVQATAAALDPSGELQAELNRICAEAVASAAGGMVRPSPPKAEAPPDRTLAPEYRPIVLRTRRQ
jgi:hypothetical protein